MARDRPGRLTREFRIGVDIGGTFTDCVVVAPGGERTVAKALTTHDALADGVLQALAVAAGELGRSREDLLRATDLLVHGTTVATNALLTRRGVSTGLLTTRGHEDTLAIGKVFSKRAGLTEREIVHSSRLEKPVPLVPPTLVRGIVERVDATGEVLLPLDEHDAAAAIDELVAAGVEALAICLLWSFANDLHERRLGELVAERAPGVFVALSCEIAPVLGEYERACTTALTAYVGPRVAGYLEELETRLRDEGLRRPLLVMQAGGGLTSAADASRRPIVTLDSGPTGGILGAQHLASLYGERNVVCTDVGGTSFEVGLIRDGELPLDEDPIVAQLNLRVPKVTVRSIGAGGGSLAWLDAGGLLRVGPQSAGSQPGPACYGLGGTEPTVTDADLVLGYLNESSFLGGRMALRRDLALAALRRLGAPLGLEPEEVANGIFRILNAQMADLIRRATIEQGHDPRDCVLVAYGGAGPTHAAFYGRDIGVRSILIPTRSTAFSAEGMLGCDVTHTAQGARFLASPIGAEELELLADDFAALEQRIGEQFASEHVTAVDVTIVRELGVRYRRQAHTIATELDAGPLNADAIAALKRRFERRYASVYGEGSLLEEVGIELELQRVVGTHAVARPELARHPVREGGGGDAVRGERSVFWEGHGYVDTPVLAGSALRAGDRVTGPALIERMGDSVVVPGGFTARVDEYLTLELRTVPR